MIKSKFPNSYRVYHYTEFLPFWPISFFHVCAREFRPWSGIFRKSTQKRIDTPPILPDDDGDGATRHPSAPADRRSGRGLFQTRRTARGVF